MEFFNGKVKPLIADAKLLELVGLSAEYDRLHSKIKLCKSLSTLTEDSLLSLYRSGLKITGAKPFPSNFTKQNSEAFYRLKLRLIEQRLEQAEPGMSA